ncbi:DUF6925 family protein [Methylobacterium nodulans]|uniref:Uncharacterized protein n=1 Tax=Methylobacterium nodulans (strain LMG 21967 / CNCM I-2342 / ORS 2060) TaxID=460265 RepID=B8IIZ8_METNO|nr:hypothetical protein [Methylobacterium nodulans]ACL61793.1 conserved hypothetical protein [Methylobacterium nodulans ORS 2060]
MSRPPPDPAAVRALIEAALADPATTWTFGAYGAAIAFARAPGEAAEPLCGRFGLVTARGALAFGDLAGLHPVAYETALGGEAWSHAVELCIDGQACGSGAPDQVTQIGPDAGAVRPRDRAAILFDLGLGLRAARLCLRSHDPGACAILRAACGRSLCDDEARLAALLALPCDRVVLAGRHRAEAAAGSGAPGARLQILPKLLRLRRSHAATAPIPPGLMPIAMIQPPHPLAGTAAFDRARHAAFQGLLAAWGDPDLVALKRRILAGEDAPPPTTRAGRAVARIAQAQARALQRSASATGGDSPTRPARSKMASAMLPDERKAALASGPKSREETPIEGSRAATPTPPC